ncbi:hypothetical protein [Streptomyces sp. SID5643]|uniref:hypothetical protein n=1 Tax=Streptomyces sp. SID5643 TaxID=2690307 RepID=UPI0019261E4F|nr:hypothetical protein [Streptomyces sp. SID5643]
MPAATAALPVPAASFDEQAVSSAAPAAGPPVSMALRCGDAAALMWAVPGFRPGSGSRRLRRLR